MTKLEVGQELEFIEAVKTQNRTISKGTLARVGALTSEIVEDKIMLVIHGGASPEVLTLDRHLVALHCRPV